MREREREREGERGTNRRRASSRCRSVELLRNFGVAVSTQII